MNHKALDAVSAESRKAAAQEASTQTEGATPAQSVMAQRIACPREVPGMLTAQMPLEDLSESLCSTETQCEMNLAEALHRICWS